MDFPNEVICAVDHSLGLVKRGEIYPVLAFEVSPCRCHDFLYDVGITSPVAKGKPTVLRCKWCGFSWSAISDGHYWLGSKLFTTLLTDSEARDLKEVIENCDLVTI